MKKALGAFFVLLAGLSLVSTTAHAALPQPDALYMTLEGETGQKSVFEWNEEPHVYMSFPGMDTSRSYQIGWVWKYGTTEISNERASSDEIREVMSQYGWDGQTAYFDLKGWANMNETDWEDARQAGEWSVRTWWKYADSGLLASRRSVFTVNGPTTVTPEPISAALFLIGGLALSTRKFFNKNPK